MKVIITDEISEEGLQPLLADPRIELDVKLKLPKEELHRIIGNYEVIITRSGTPVDRALVEHAKNLKIVARAGVGIDNVDVDACSEHGIIVVNAPFGNVNSAAEHSLAILMTLLRNVAPANADLKGGAWNRGPFTGYELKDKTLGIIGLGKVGGRVALRAKAFEMNVIACDPYISEKRAEDHGVKLMSLDDVCRYADIISLHCPLNEETRDMFVDAHFAKMKQGVVIVNCARGGIINEKAMLDALNSGKVSGAAFDVWTEEPPKTPSLWELIRHPKMIVTPHLGANTHEAQKNVAVDVSKEIIKYLNGQPMSTAVNIPKFDPDLLDHMRPFMVLVEQMGEFISQLAPKNPRKVSFDYHGEVARFDCAPLTVTGLAALLDAHTEVDVNLVNARMVARSVGLEVEEIRNAEHGSFSNLITITVETGDSKRTVSGTLWDGIPKIVRMRDFMTDFTPEPHLLVLHYPDKPGAIGKIGTLLGEAGINIGNMNLGRRQKAGEAMVVLSLDTPASDELVAAIKEAIDAHFVKAVHMKRVK